MEKNNLQLAIQLRHELHAHPELSNQEAWTKQHLIEFLKTHTNLEVVDKGRWFYAVYHSKVGKRNIAFRADFDASRLRRRLNFLTVRSFLVFLINVVMMDIPQLFAALPLKSIRRALTIIYSFYSNMPRKLVMVL